MEDGGGYGEGDGGEFGEDEVVGVGVGDGRSGGAGAVAFGAVGTVKAVVKSPATWTEGCGTGALAH